MPKGSTELRAANKVCCSQQDIINHRIVIYCLTHGIRKEQVLVTPEVRPIDSVVHPLEAIMGRP